MQTNTEILLLEVGENELRRRMSENSRRAGLRQLLDNIIPFHAVACISRTIPRVMADNLLRNMFQGSAKARHTLTFVKEWLGRCYSHPPSGVGLLAGVN